jgi:hypothetical protein
MYLNNCIQKKNYDILSIINFKKDNNENIINKFHEIKQYYEIYDRNSLYLIKKYYEYEYYNNKTDLSKIKYIMILCMGNKNDSTEKFIKYLINFKNNIFEEDIIELEKRLEKLKTTNSDSDDENNNNNNNNTGVIIKKRIVILN